MVQILNPGQSDLGLLAQALGKGIPQAFGEYGKLQQQQQEAQQKRLSDLTKNATKLSKEYHSVRPGIKRKPENETEFQRRLVNTLAENPDMILSEAGDLVYKDLLQKKAQEGRGTGEPLTEDTLWQKIFMGTPKGDQRLAQELGVEEPKGFLGTVIDRYKQQVEGPKRLAEAFGLGTTATPGIPRDVLALRDMFISSIADKFGISEETQDTLKNFYESYTPTGLLEKHVLKKHPSGEVFQEAFKESFGIEFEPETRTERIAEAAGGGIIGGATGILIGAAGQGAVEAGAPPELVPFIQLAAAIASHHLVRAGKKFDAKAFGKKTANQIEFKELSKGTVEAGESLRTNMAKLSRETGESSEEVFSRIVEEAKKRGISPEKVGTGDESAIKEMNKISEDLLKTAQEKRAAAQKKSQEKTTKPKAEPPFSPLGPSGAGMEVFGKEKPSSALTKTAEKVIGVEKPVALTPEGLKKSPERKKGVDFFAQEVENLAETPLEEHFKDRSIKTTGLKERQDEYRPAIEENKQEIQSLQKRLKTVRDPIGREAMGKRLDVLERENYELQHAINYGTRPTSPAQIKEMAEKSIPDLLENFINPTPASEKRFQTAMKRLDTLAERFKNEYVKKRLPPTLAEDYFVTLHDAYLNVYEDMAKTIEQTLKDPDALLYDSKEGRNLLDDLNQRIEKTKKAVKLQKQKRQVRKSLRGPTGAIRLEQLRNMEKIPKHILADQARWQKIQKKEFQKLQNLSEPKIQKIGKLLSEKKFKEASQQSGIPEEKLKGLFEDVDEAVKGAEEDLRNENVSQKAAFEKFKTRMKKAMDDFSEKKRSQKAFEGAKTKNLKAQQKEIEELQKKTNRFLKRWGWRLVKGILSGLGLYSYSRPQGTVNKFFKAILRDENRR